MFSLKTCAAFSFLSPGFVALFNNKYWSSLKALLHTLELPDQHHLLAVVAHPVFLIKTVPEDCVLKDIL